MPRGYRCILIALAGIGLAYPVEQAAYGQPRPAESNQSAEAQVQPGSLSAIEKSIDRLTRAIEAGQREPQPDAERKQAERDLAAQEGMWTWAKVAAVVAGVMALLTFIGLLLIWRTLIQTARAADYAGTMADEAGKTTKAAIDAAEAGSMSARAARRAAMATTESNRIARESMHRGLRAYLGVVGATVDSLTWGKVATVTIQLTNCGKTPAYDVLASIAVRVLPAGSQIEVTTSEGLPMELAPEQSIFLEGSDGPISAEEFEDLRTKAAHLYVGIFATYRDAFGERQTFSTVYNNNGLQALSPARRVSNANESDGA